MKLMTKEIAKALVKAADWNCRCASEGNAVTTEIDIVVKYFTPDAQCTWFIVDGRPEGDDWQLYGFCDLGIPHCAELGYVMLSELEGVRGALGLPIERDLYFPKTTLADVLKKYSK